MTYQSPSRTALLFIVPASVPLLGSASEYAPLFWPSLLDGLALPAALLAAGAVAVFPLAGLLALAGLWLYGHALVLAGQGPPIS